MLQNRKDFLYFENKDFQAVNLPYGESKKLSMYVFLPKGDMSVFPGNLNLDNWSTWVKSFKEKEGTLELPRFKIEYATSLIDPLVKLGMTKAFSSEADFSKIRSEKDIYISEVKHKTFIEVNEEGTEAAAVTSIGIAMTALPLEAERPFYMTVNKPFFFAIADSDSGQILFTGFIYNPVSI
jgi:serine protease inhibitor